MKKVKKHIIIASIDLTPEFKQKLDQVTDDRGMTIKVLLGRLIEWFSELDRTEQSLVLGQIENADTKTLTSLLAKRR